MIPKLVTVSTPNQVPTSRYIHPKSLCPCGAVNEKGHSKKYKDCCGKVNIVTLPFKIKPIVDLRRTDASTTVIPGITAST